MDKYIKAKSVKPKVDMSDTFGQYKVRKYTSECNYPNDMYNVVLTFEEKVLEHLEIEDSNEASCEYNMIRNIIKHAADQIKLAEEAGVAFGKKHA